VHQWLKRFNPNYPDWFKDQSRRPKSSPDKTDSQIEEAVAMIRQELVTGQTPDLEYSFTGAIAIHQEMDKRKFQDIPSPRTINRILKKRNLVTKKSKGPKNKSKKYYPELLALYPNHRHEMDLVTPRYISGYGKVVSVNRIDVFSGHVNLQVYQAKGADEILEFLVEDWKRFGIPDYLQLDNEASFRGGLRHPRSFGKLLRFCLNFGVQIIFIPWEEPWRNPYIENFNGNFNRLLWLKKRFQDLDHLRAEAKRFLIKVNDYQTYKKDRFSKAQALSHTLRFFPENFHFEPGTALPITKGKLHFVRLVEQDGTIVILNERFEVDRNLSFEYVWTTIDTEQQMLSIYHQPAEDQKRILVKELKYQLREEVKDPIPVKNFCGLLPMS
jgi:hypothetical protein